MVEYDLINGLKKYQHYKWWMWRISTLVQKLSMDTNIMTVPKESADTSLIKFGINVRPPPPPPTQGARATMWHPEDTDDYGFQIKGS